MKRKNKVVIIIVVAAIFLLLIWIISPVFFFFCYNTSISIDYANIKAGIPEIIMTYQGVESVEILYDEDFLEFEIDIHLIHSGRLLLGNVNDKLRGNFRIERVGNYDILLYDLLTNDMLGFLLHTRLDSVKDVVLNYNKVYSLVKS
jgi:hypothetical protein